MQSQSVFELEPHPHNARIYGEGRIDDLIESIRREGVLEPLVITPSRVIISGHRRHRAAVALGLETVPVVVRSFDDEVTALIEFNRYRRKTWSQVHAECLELVPRLKEAAEKRRLAGARVGGLKRHGTTSGAGGQPRSRVIDDLERCVGINRERLRRLLRIFEAVEAGTAPREIVERLDAGSLTVHEAYRRVRKVQRIDRIKKEVDLEVAAGRYDVRDLVSPFDVWQFHQRDPRFGRLGTPSELLDNDFGAPPPQLMVNVLHHFTSEGDLIVDPMAGNGTMADVCRFMRRRCVSSDLNPKRPDIQSLDALLGPPAGTAGTADLLFLDPPYGDQRRYSEHPQDLGNAESHAEFLDRLDRVLDLWLPVLAEGGLVALVIGSEFRGGQMVDRAWDAGRMLERHARIRRRIWAPHPPSFFPAYRVAKAIDHRQMLSRICEVFIAEPT